MALPHAIFYLQFWFRLVWLGLLLLVFGCFFVLIFGSKRSSWSHKSEVSLRSDIGWIFLVWWLTHYVGFIEGTGFFVQPADFGLWEIDKLEAGIVFLEVPSLGFGQRSEPGLELGSRFIHLAGFKIWSSGFIKCAMSEFVGPKTTSGCVQLRIWPLGSTYLPGLLSGPSVRLLSNVLLFFGLQINYCCCWILRAQTRVSSSSFGLPFNCCCCWILKARSRVLSSVFVEWILPKRKCLLNLNNCLEYLCFVQVVYFCFNVCNRLVHLGRVWKDIIPTRILYVSRRCIFSEVLNPKACFGDSLLGWRGYAPLNM